MMNSIVFRLLERLRARSIRTQLILLVLCVTLPALAIIIYTGIEQYREEFNEAQQECTAIVSSVATEQENLVAAARQLLSTLSTLPELKRRDAAACNTLFHNLLRQNTQFVSLSAATPDGTGFASGAPFTAFNVADRKFFKDVLATRDFSAGEYAISHTTGKPTLHFASPVLGERGEITAVVQAGIDLERYNQLLSLAHAPADAGLVITDSGGRSLYHPNKNMEGQVDSPVIFKRMNESGDADSFEEKGLDSVRRIIAYRALRLGEGRPPYIYIRVGIPESTVFRKARIVTQRNLGLLGLAALLAVVAAWVLGEVRIVRPVKRLLAASERLAGGDLKVRSGIPADSGELGQLAHSFDEMAVSLATREEERNRALEELRRTEEQLRQVQKMEALGTLAGGIAHDFNNILTGILGYASVLTMEHKEGSPTHEAARIIERAAERATELTRQLLGFARKGKMLNVPVAIDPLIEEVTRLLQRTLDKNITLISRLGAPQATIQGDPNQLQQVLLNLAVNARDAMAGGGELIIESRLAHLAGSESPDPAQLAPGRYVTIAVSDAGSGIPKALQDRIFEPFFTTKALGKETGMGLAMVYGIVKNHNGAIRLDSEEGRGSRFTLYLPASPENDPPTQPDEVPAALPRGTGRIMVVDDENMILSLASSMLARLGYQVEAFNGGAEAVRYYRRHGRGVDLVLMDMVMPEMDGGECFAALKLINPGVRAILSSGYSREGRAQTILEEGMLGFVQKPFRIEDLAAAVDKAIKGEKAG